jgi:hypothetical protein
MAMILFKEEASLKKPGRISGETGSYRFRRSSFRYYRPDEKNRGGPEYRELMIVPNFPRRFLQEVSRSMAFSPAQGTEPPRLTIRRTIKGGEGISAAGYAPAFIFWSSAPMLFMRGVFGGVT